MDIGLVAAWLGCGLLCGGVLVAWLNPAPRRWRAAASRAAALEQQSRRQIDQLRRELQASQADLDAARVRHERQLASLREAHAKELRSAENALRLVREQLQSLEAAAESGRVISGTAFQPTQFDTDPDL